MISRLIAILLVFSPILVAAQGKPVPVPLKNPGFEEELRGWDNADDPELAGVFSLAGDAMRSGKHSLHMQSQMPGQWPWVSQKIEKIEAGALYHAKVWVRCTEAGQTTAAIRLEFTDETGQPLESRYLRRPAPPNNWAQLLLAAQAPAGATGAVLSLRLLGETEVWFDDVELLRVSEAPSVVARPLRLALMPGEPRTVHLEIVGREDFPETAPGTPTLSDPAGKAVKMTGGEWKRVEPRLLAGDFELPALSPGTHTWRAKLSQGTAEGRLYVATNNRQPKNLTDRGFLKVADKVVFPIGIYHASVGDYQTLEQRKFNAVQGLATQDSRLLRTAMGEAARAKLMVDIPLHYGGMVAANLVASQQKLQFLAKDPGVSGWKLADEPDLRPEIEDEVPEAYLRLKQKDDRRPLLLTIERPETYAYWAHFCDALQVVCFPLPGKPLTLVSERVAKARQALQPWQHLSVLLQAGWLPGGDSQPTFAQARAMVYLAVINGAQGIYWYSLRDPGWQLAETPLWEKFEDLNSETARLGEIAVSGQKVVLENDNAKLQSAAWNAGGATQMMLANPEPDPQTARLKLPQPVTKALVVLGKADFEVVEGALAVTLEPGGAALVSAEVQN